ncbi:MAG: hypothetical protein ACE5GE_00225 [Phycisphaerae bacterium]
MTATLTPLVYACLGAICASPKAASRLVVDFGTSAQTEAGSFFGCAGGRPDTIADRIDLQGEPARWAWRVEVSAKAAASGVGAVVPLSAPPSKHNSSRADNSGRRFLALQAVGALGARKLRLELRSSAAGGPSEPMLAEFGASDLSDGSWRQLLVPLPPGWDGSALLHMLLEGQGSAWFALDSIHVVRGDGHLPVVGPKDGEPSRDLRYALWVWKKDRILPDAANRKELLDFSQGHGITDLFVQVPYTYENGMVSLRLAEHQRSLIGAAHERGMTVHALDGRPQYVLKKNHGRMERLVAALADFNRQGTARQRYDAVHLDNEPYILPEWQEESSRKIVLNDYLELNRTLRQQSNQAGMKFGVDIPFWFDQTDAQGRPRFEVKLGSVRKPLLEALFGVVDNVGVMSYRERITGSNGVVACCAREFQLGKEFGVNVFASVELGTGPEVEAGTTFGVYPFEYFRDQLSTLARIASRTAGCAGIAIHYYDPYRKLESQP